eukprot:6162451-Alexandrium_andersonii.AAC.1
MVRAFTAPPSVSRMCSSEDSVRPTQIPRPQRGASLVEAFHGHLKRQVVAKGAKRPLYSTPIVL